MSLELKEEFERTIDPKEALEKISNIGPSLSSKVYKEYEKDVDDKSSQYVEYSDPPTKYYLIPEIPIITVKYHKEICPELIKMEKIDDRGFINLRSAENIKMKKGDLKHINLGISVKFPSGYHAEVFPVSSLYSIVMPYPTIIKESCCKDDFIWKIQAIAMSDTEIKINDIICKFRLVKDSGTKMVLVED